MDGMVLVNDILKDLRVNSSMLSEDYGSKEVTEMTKDNWQRIINYASVMADHCHALAQYAGAKARELELAEEHCKGH